MLFFSPYKMSTLCLELTVFLSSPQCREYVSQYSSLVVEQLMNMVGEPILLLPLCCIFKERRMARCVDSLHSNIYKTKTKVSILTFFLHVVVLFPYFVCCSPGTGRCLCLACSDQTFELEICCALHTSISMTLCRRVHLIGYE